MYHDAQSTHFSSQSKDKIHLHTFVFLIFKNRYKLTFNNYIVSFRFEFEFLSFLIRDSVFFSYNYIIFKRKLSLKGISKRKIVHH